MYALLFADTGLSDAQISSLFVLWSVSSFLVEIPSGLWADVFSRRKLLILAPLITASGYALWTFFPSYPAFAAGFLLWGTGSALSSGAREALVYEELTRLGAADEYARITGRARALETTAVTASSLVAAPVMAAGGYLAVGIASVIVPVLTSLVAWSLPETRGDGPEDEEEPGFRDVLREGLAEVRGNRVIRRLFLVLALLSGASAMDEFLPLLAAGTGVAVAVVPLLVLLPTIGDTVGGWLAGRGERRLVPALVLAAACLAAGAAFRHPGGFVLVGVAFGIFQWAMVGVEAKLQDEISDHSRATVTSMSGFGIEVMAVLIFAAYGFGSLWSPSWLLFTIAALPYLAVAYALSAGGRPSPGTRRAWRPGRSR